MNPERWQEVQKVLDAFDDLPAAERPAFMGSVACDDSKLCREVESFLANEDKLDTFLDRPLFPVCSENLDEAVLVPRIGSYKLVRELGEGGMGVVYLAVREEDFSKQVALKLIRPEMFSPETVRRFKVEMQILAQVHHPNVAEIYDGGTTPDGRPYFVMEYVEGLPIEEYCDTQGLTTQERLELFLQVCLAVQLAHRKLHVHRDLKPGNILVTADRVAKLLDFGIAKLLDSPSRGPGGALPMSAWVPQFSAPEQLAGLPLTTACDIYSLGVLLYRLLTGRLPHHVESNHLEDFRQAILEQEPEKPSVAVQRSEDRSQAGTSVRLTPASVSRVRDGSLRKLRRRLAGDVDAIVLKALAKDPEDRYSSVEQLADDIRRYRGRWPVRARELTVLYRVSKFVRRHPRRLAGVAVLVILCLGLVFSQTQLVRAQADLIATQDRAFLSWANIVKALQPATPDQKVEIEKALEEAERITEDPMFADQPRNQTLLMDTVGRVYIHLSRYDQARARLEKALEIRRRVLGPDHPLVAESLHNLAYLYQRVGEIVKAEGLLREVVRIRSQSSDSDESELSRSLNLLATLLSDRGCSAEAEELFREVLDTRRSVLHEEHPDVVRARNNLATALEQQGAYDEAEPLYRQNLEIRLESDGPEHTDVARSRLQLATVLYARGNVDAAELQAREALQIWRRIYGPRHSNVAVALNNLGMYLQAAGDLEGAETVYRQALDIFSEHFDDDHGYVAVTRKNLAALLTAKGDSDSAMVLARQALGALSRTMASGSWQIAEAESVYGGCLIAMGRFAEAEELLMRSFDTLREVRGAQSPNTLGAARRLADLYEALGQPEKAEEYRRAATRGGGPRHAESSNGYQDRVSKVRE